jgi:hypothetical protein
MYFGQMSMGNCPSGQSKCLWANVSVLSRHQSEPPFLCLSRSLADPASSSSEVEDVVTLASAMTASVTLDEIASEMAEIEQGIIMIGRDVGFRWGRNIVGSEGVGGG